MSSFSRRWSRLLATLATALIAFWTAAAPAFAQGPPSFPFSPNASSLPAIETVVLVDESGSLSQANVAQEAEAARSIALSALSPGSVITVVGFGSSDREGHSAVDVVCPPTVLDTAQQRDEVATCISKLHPRTAAEGYNTDQLAALQQALHYLDDGSRNPKVVFLLTDGKLDVPDTVAYGPARGTPAQTEAARNAVALSRIPGVLADLKKIGAQVWPLGFGAADETELSRFAEGQSCDPQFPAPAARVIGDPAELPSAILDAFRSATCLGVKPPPHSPHVQHPPGLFQRFWWVLVVAIALLIIVIAAGVIARQKHRERRAVRGLQVELYRAGAKIDHITPPDLDADVFGFDVHDNGFLPVKLVRHVSTDKTAPYALRRHGDGLQLTLPPSEEPTKTRTFTLGGRIPIPTEMELVIRDERADTAQISVISSPVSSSDEPGDAHQQ